MITVHKFANYDEFEDWIDISRKIYFGKSKILLSQIFGYFPYSKQVMLENCEQRDFFFH